MSAPSASETPAPKVVMRDVATLNAETREAAVAVLERLASVDEVSFGVLDGWLGDLWRVHPNDDEMVRLGEQWDAADEWRAAAGAVCVLIDRVWHGNKDWMCDGCAKITAGHAVAFAERTGQVPSFVTRFGQQFCLAAAVACRDQAPTAWQQAVRAVLHDPRDAEGFNNACFVFLDNCPEDEPPPAAP